MVLSAAPSIRSPLRCVQNEKETQRVDLIANDWIPEWAGEAAYPATKYQ